MRRAKAAYSEFSVTGCCRLDVKVSLTVFAAGRGAACGELGGAGGHGVSWAVTAGGVAPGGLHPVGADHCLERELSRAWPRRDFHDALAVPGPSRPDVGLVWQGERS